MQDRKRWMIPLALLSGMTLSGCIRSCGWNPTVPNDPRLMPTQPGVGDGRRTPPLLNLRGRLPAEWTPDGEQRHWTSIVIHHTATNRGNVESIHEAHRNRTDAAGNHWLGIGYHFVIGNGNGMADGAIEPTFRWRQQLHGAHAGVNEYNQHGIGIALVGNFEKHPPTAAQLAAVKRLVSVLKSAYGLTADDVVGHGDIRATACPGKYFPIAEVSFTVPEILLGQAPRAQTHPQPDGLE